MHITIDRFEGSLAVVELPDKGTVNVPAELFPGAKEGDVYLIAKDEAQAKQRQKRIDDKFDRLKKK